MKQMNWMSILGLCLIVLGTVFSFFGTYFSDKQGQMELTEKIQEKNDVIDTINTSNSRLIDQNTSLIESNSRVTKSNDEALVNNKDLLSQNVLMLDKISKYQDDIEERNKKIQELENQVNNVKEYTFYADMDITGRNISTGSGLTFTSGITVLMDKILEKTDNVYIVKSSPKTLEYIDEVIIKFPKFPFGHYAKAIYLKSHKKNDWQLSAKKAVEIFEVTTSINGHHINQDQAFAELKTMLRQ